MIELRSQEHLTVSGLIEITRCEIERFLHHQPTDSADAGTLKGESQS